MAQLAPSVASSRVHPRLVAGGVAIAGVIAAFAIGRGSESVVAVSLPPILAAAPSITVMPAPVLVAAPAAAEVAEQPKTFPPRALAPWLDVDCIAPLTDERDATCEWDAGFPAISADGTQIAQLASSPSSGQESFYDQFVEIVDARSSRVVRTLPLITLAESEPFEDNAEPNPRGRARVRRIVAPRVTRALAVLEAQRFRSMVNVGSSSFSDSDEDKAAPPTDKVYADIAAEAVRIIDPVANVVLWRGDLTVAGGTGNPDEGCSGWWPQSLTTWWDAKTSTVAAAWTYRTGGCLCPDVAKLRIARVTQR